MKAELPGTVKFIFQPAEEGSPPGERGGATLMIEQGVLENPRPEVIFGLHTKASLDVGVIGYTPGPALAATDQFRAVIRGRQAHGSSPHLSIDPVVTAAQAIVALQTIRSRNLSPFEPSVVTVGMVRGGTRWNIIPGAVELEGTVRSYGAGVSDTVERRMREILAGITSAAGATYELTYVRYVPATVNDTVLTRRMVPSLARSVGAANARQIQPWMAGEDFSRYTNIIPGFFFMLGVQKPGAASGDHHAPNFMADDSAIPVGVKAMVNVVLDYLDGRGR
jgi:amidohydrolase